MTMEFIGMAVKPRAWHWPVRRTFNTGILLLICLISCVSVGQEVQPAGTEDFDGDGLVGDLDPDEYVADTSFVIIKIRSFDFTPISETVREIIITSEDVVLDQSAFGYGIQHDSGIEVKTRFDAHVTPLSLVGLSQARISAHSNTSSELRFKMSKSSTEKYERVSIEETKITGWNLKINFNISNSGPAKCRLEDFAVKLLLNDEHVSTHRYIEAEDGNGRENEGERIEQNKSIQVTCLWELKTKLVEGIFTQSPVITFVVNPAEIKTSENGEPKDQAQFSNKCCKLIVFDREQNVTAQWVSTIPDTDKPPVTIEELLRRAMGKDAVAWGTFNDMDYLQNLGGESALPIPLPYKEESGYWSAHFTHKGKEQQLAGSWKSHHVNPGDELTLVYRPIEHYLHERYAYQVLPEVAREWQRVRDMENKLWETVTREDAGVRNPSPGVVTQRNELINQYDDLRARYPQLFGSDFFDVPYKRFKKTIGLRLYEWEPFTIKMSRADASWTITKENPPKWVIEDPYLEITIGGKEYVFEPADFDGKSVRPSKKIKLGWETILYPADIGSIEFEWKPFSQIKLYFFEDDTFPNPNEDLIDIANASFYSLAFMAGEKEFDKLPDPENGQEPTHSMVKDKTKFWLTFLSINGPHHKTLASKDLPSKDADTLIKEFLDDSLPRVVGQPAYIDLFDDPLKVAIERREQGTQLGYYQAAIIFHASYRELGKPGSKTKQQYENLLNAIQDYFLALHYEKVNELGEVLERSKKQMILTEGFLPTRIEEVERIVRAAREARKLNNEAPLLAHAYAMTALMWDWTRVRLGSIATEKARDDVIKECEKLEAGVQLSLKKLTDDKVDEDQDLFLYLVHIGENIKAGIKQKRESILTP